MLAGKRLFQGDDVVSAVPAEVLPLLKQCVEKDPKKRLRDIGDWQLLLANTPQPVHAASAAFRLASIAAGVLAVIAAVLAAVSFILFRQKPPAPNVIRRFQHSLPEGQSFTRRGRHDVAISPDGTKLAAVLPGESDRLTF